MKEYLIDGKDRFEIVDHFPLGYRIWNIGKNMPDGYLPLVQTVPSDSYSVIPDTMKAIKIEGAQTVLAAIGFGPETVEEMEAYIAEHNNPRATDWERCLIDRYQKAIPILRQIKRY